MPVTVIIRDETAAGDVFHEHPLELPSERISVRDLIRERVYQEVQDFNQRQHEQIFRGLVQPTDAERVLNGGRPEFHLKQRRQIEWKPQFEKAQEAFLRNGFFILIDDRQAAELDEEFDVGPKSQISFVKLTLLVGG
jgi:hypothetical protein